MEEDIDLLWKKKLIFSGVFVLENKLHTVLDRYLEGITSKQWLVLVVSSSFPTPPDLSKVGKALGCSRQNIKKLALALEKEGMVSLIESESDGRSLCIHLTVKGRIILQNSKNLENKVYNSLFKEFTQDDINSYYSLSKKFNNGIDHLEKCFLDLKEKGEI